MSIHSIRDFIISLSSDLKKLNELIASLEKQYELLSRRKSQELETLNRDILNLIHMLYQSNLQREHYMHKLGLPSNKRGIQTLREKLPSPLKEATGKLLEELAIKSGLCSMMNEKSGHILATQKQMICRMMGAQDQLSYPQLPLGS